MDTVFITGHRNPDTDSIVSAMAYAALKNALGHREYQAARLGQVSDETQLVLDRFAFQPPRRITDVRTQVRDLDYDTPPTLSAAATISLGWKTMMEEQISVIPVANEDGTLCGMLSAGDVANYDMTRVRDSRVGEIPVFNLLSVLEGKILNEGGELRDVISGEVTIALPAGRENLLFSNRDSIVICGNQPDMICRAVDLGINCVVVCQAEVEQSLLDRAGDTCIISTPIDAYQAVRLISHALPISKVCKTGDVVCFHLDDYLDDVQDTVLESRFRAYPILDEDERVVGMLSRYHLLRPRRKRVILMDHNEMAPNSGDCGSPPSGGYPDQGPHLCPERGGGQHHHHCGGDVPGEGPYAHRQNGGPYGGGHCLRHGHVQIPHLHPEGYRYRQPVGQDREYLPG